ncbi:MAG: cytochrome bd ubiquinol oxidase subunit [Micromonosporaceae bacterium]|nr:cytochrome bd ubiquinol oxidase subunit [Micromonosporaceae bacterium]
MLAEIPMVFILIGLAAYTVLAGADFGSGIWTLFPVGGQSSRAATRDFARHAMGPVWEANHVWLIFVLVVCWTAYPVAYASIVSTLTVPLFIAAVGIILRGASYALREQLEATREQRFVESVFALSSVLTPFALGAVTGAVASGRVPVGNAKGNLVTSWLNPTSVLVGILAVAVSSYLAAVYLAADARRLGQQELERDFRSRALWSGLVTGALALAGLLVVRLDARPFWNGLTSAGGLAMVGLSAAAGIVTLILVWRSRFGPARASAALAVVAIVAGWAVAQQPRLLPGLTVSQAAASRSTLIAVIVAVVIGAIVLVPSLLLLFGLFLRGRLDEGPRTGVPVLETRGAAGRHRPRLVAVFALACLLVGAGLTVLTDAGVTLAVGIVCLCACAVSAFVLATTTGETDT